MAMSVAGVMTVACEDGKPTATVDTAATSDSAASDVSVGDAKASDTVAGTGDGNSTDTVGGSDGGADAGQDVPAPKLSSCSAVGQCVSDNCAKNESGCEKPCFGDGTPEAVAKAGPLLIRLRACTT